METENKTGILLAVLAAALYAVSSPFSKILLQSMPPTLLAGFLYLGAGLGMAFLGVIRKSSQYQSRELKLTKKEIPCTLAMVLLDIAAPICLMLGLDSTTAAHASLLNNFEIVATALVALLCFKEQISKRLWLGILFVTTACMLLSFEDLTSLELSSGSLLILLACIFWGIENNCTRKLSSKDPLQIVLLKGIFSGLGSIIIGLLIGEHILYLRTVFAAMGVGLISYGLSIFTYVYAQRYLGAARTGAYYAVAPFISVLLSFVIFREIPNASFLAAFALMIIGARLSSSD